MFSLFGVLFLHMLGKRSLGPGASLDLLGVPLGLCCQSYLCTEELRIG